MVLMLPVRALKLGFNTVFSKSLSMFLAEAGSNHKQTAASKKIVFIMFSFINSLAELI